MSAMEEIIEADNVPTPNTIVGPVHLPLRIGEAIVSHELWYYDFGQDRWVATFTGNIRDNNPVPLRIESACIFGHIFYSAKCDCSYQLDEALQRIGEAGRGLVIYGIDQDARGLGIEAHFRIYVLRQQENLDTQAVYERLQAPVDARSYEPVAAILRHLGVHNILLLSNNPRRQRFLLDHGFAVQMQSIEAPLDVHNMSTLMLEKEDLGYQWSFNTHGDWLTPLQATVDGTPDLQAAQLVADTNTLLIEAKSQDWNVAYHLAGEASATPSEAQLIVYLTDFPRLDELSIYAAMGTSFVVVPFADIPDWLYAAGDDAGLRIQDWGRYNQYVHPRPQWHLLHTDETIDVYRQQDRLRCVFRQEASAVQAASHLRSMHQIAQALFPSRAPRVNRVFNAEPDDGPSWIELNLPDISAPEVLTAHGFRVDSWDQAYLVMDLDVDQLRAVVGSVEPAVENLLQQLENG